MHSPNPTAAVNLDFETGDLYAWQLTNRGEGFSAAVVSPGHVRSGVTSNYALSMSKEAGVTTGYGFSSVSQAIPHVVAGQTYRFEFSWKYTVDVDSKDVCSAGISFWSIQLANVCQAFSTPL